MLKFYGSPEGQAIVAVESDMTNDLARMGLESVREAQQSIYRNFCPSHPEVCVNDVGRHPILPPKS